MSLGDRLGLGGLIVAFFGIAAFYLWPEKKSIGWVSLAAALALVLTWLSIEFKDEAIVFFHDYPIKGTVLIAICGGVLTGTAWWFLVARIPPSVASTAEPTSPLLSEPPQPVLSPKPEQKSNPKRADKPQPPPPSKPLSNQEVPQITMTVVSPDRPRARICASHGVVENVRVDPLVWDIDREDGNLDSLTVNDATYPWIKPETGCAMQWIIRPELVGSIVKPGHRIIGYVVADCPACKPQGLFIYFVYGTNGWYSRIPEGQGPNLGAFGKAIKDVYRDPNIVLSGVPQTQRIPIGPWPQL